MHYPVPGDRVRLHPGGLRHGLPVLRHGPGRVPAPTQRKARSSSRWPRPCGRPGRGGSPTWSSWAWASPWPTTTGSGSGERLHGDMGLSARHLTALHGGHRAGIRRLAAESLPVNLAVSLHAANDTLRDVSSPSTGVTRSTARRRLRRRRGGQRPPPLDRVGHDPRRQRPGSDAAELAAFARPLGAHVNLIPLNPTPGYPVVGSSRQRGRHFRDELLALGERHHPHHQGRRDRRRLRAARRPAPPHVGTAG